MRYKHVAAELFLIIKDAEKYLPKDPIGTHNKKLTPTQRVAMYENTIIWLMNELDKRHRYLEVEESEIRGDRYFKVKKV